jgi:hypothetical protein
MSRSVFDTWPRGGADQWDQDNAGALLTAEFFEAPASTAGTLRYWNGSAWIAARLRRWNGTSWELTTLRLWDGANWVAVTT